uniref:Uncharacterized protein n=1 Tax=Parascaris equorum TaxID=6256 RepID=A0A914R2Q7_PAREQ
MMTFPDNSEVMAFPDNSQVMTFPDNSQVEQLKGLDHRSHVYDLKFYMLIIL